MADLAGYPDEWDVTSTPTDLDDYEYAQVGEDEDGLFYCIASTVGTWLGTWVCTTKLRPVPYPYATRPVPGPPLSQKVPPVIRRIRRHYD